MITFNKHISELRLRIISASILSSLALLSIWTGGFLFQAFWGVTALLCFVEIINVTMPGIRVLQYCVAAFMIIVFSNQPMNFTLQITVSLLLSCAFIFFFSLPKKRIWAFIGLLYATSFVFCMTLLRSSPQFGLHSVIWLCAIVWASDIAAFFVGRKMGGPKLLPKISPKKTWSGFLGGIIGAMAASYGVLIWSGIFPQWQHIIITIILSIASAAGDMLESAFKRHFNVKDSSRFIPGHGGVLDRADGLIAAAIIAVLMGFIHNTDPAIGLLSW